MIEITQDLTNALIGQVREAVRDASRRKAKA
jgi:hypothetical protein